MKKLYILCGLPFSGKSFLAKEMAIKSGATIVAYDDVWQALSHLNKSIDYKIVLEDCKRQIRDLLKQGFSVIYDSANPKEEHRQEFKNIAQEIGVETNVVYLDVSVKEINERRSRSLIDKTHHVVSDENFNNALQQLEPPQDAIILHNNNEKIEFLNLLE